MEKEGKSPLERDVYRGAKLWGRRIWGSGHPLLVECLALAVLLLECSDGQKPRQWALELAEDSATLEQGPGGLRATRQPCLWVSNLPPHHVQDPVLHNLSWPGIAHLLLEQGLS